MSRSGPAGAKFALLLAAGVFAAASLPGAALPGVARADAGPWRELDAAAFLEAADTGRPVFLVLDAPWNRDHFLSVPEALSDPSVAAALARGWVAVRADASARTELRRRYSLATGLLPSFHFLEADGTRFASFPPMAAEELAFYLDEMRVPANRPATPTPPASVTSSVRREELADAVAERLIRAAEDGESIAGRVHRDLDAAPLAFLLEYGSHRDDSRARTVVKRHVSGLVRGPQHDRGGGGFHRARATPDGREMHWEKTLRTNAAAASLLVGWYRRTEDVPTGAAARLVLRFLNEHLRRVGTTRYAGSLAADVWDETGTRIRLGGAGYYALDAASRGRIGAPPASPAEPVGGNFVLQRTLLDAYRVHFDDAVREGAAGGVADLLPTSFEPDGTARRIVGRAGRGSLLDQADAGIGLLAMHALLGDRDVLAAAIRLAEALVDQFRAPADDRFLDVSRRDALPVGFTAFPPDPAANGRAARFLAELAGVTGDRRWRDEAERTLAAWAASLPESDPGIAELGWAALFLDERRPLVCLAVDPDDSETVEALRSSALRVADRVTPIRWVDPGNEDDLRWAADLGLAVDGTPAIRVRAPDGRGSEALRDEVTLRAVFRAFKRSRRE